MNFKGGNGKWLTSRLFLENDYSDRSNAVYTLKDEDLEARGVHYPSLYRLYMEEADPVEYTFVSKHLGSWQQWELLCRSNWFKPFVERWRKELFLRLQSESLKEVMEVAKDPSHTSRMQALRFLIDRGWEPKNTKGRPSKEQIQKEAQKKAEEESLLEADFLKVIK